MKNNKQPDFSSLMNLLAKADNITQQKQAQNLLNTLDENQHRQLNEVLHDKNKLDALLKSPAAQQILSRIKSDSNGQH